VGVTAPMPAQLEFSTNLTGEGIGVTEQEWYSNKQLYEMMVDLSKGLEATNLELAKTQVMIKEYNGLRERLTQCEQDIALTRGRESGGKDMWGYIVGAIGVLLALISAYMR
jgi:hypothetical protein